MTYITDKVMIMMGKAARQEMADHISKRFYGLLDYKITGQPLKSKVQWENEYMIFACPHSRPDLKGYMKMIKYPLDNERHGLKIRLCRFGNDGYHCFLQMNLECLNDFLCTPVKWTFETKLAKQWDEEAYPYTCQQGECFVDRGTLYETINGKDRSKPLKGNYTFRYNLFDAIQTNGEKMDGAFSFSIIDELNVIKKDNMLKPYIELNLPSINKNMDIRSYVHTGQSVIPAVYGLGFDGRVLFYISGIEILFLINRENELSKGWKNLYEKLRNYHC